MTQNRIYRHAASESHSLPIVTHLNTMAISDWPVDCRPRERLLARGAQSLSDAELLAIFLRVGTRGKSALDLAHELLQQFGSLDRLFRANLNDWQKIQGLGTAKYSQCMAALELANRALREPLQERPLLNAPAVVEPFLLAKLRHAAVEQFMVLFLNHQLHLIQDDILFTGTLHKTAVYPREIVKRALSLHASAVMLAHNHPSGTAQPSQADWTLTQQLHRALALVDIRVVDHFIVAGDQVLSMRQQPSWHFSN